MIVENECQECGNMLFGRADKRFCSNKCRNGYNNRLNSDETNLIRNINNALRKNHRILRELNPEGTIKVDRSQLSFKGFDFRLFTSVYKSKTGKEYKYCYDQGYLMLEGNSVLLVESKL